MKNFIKYFFIFYVFAVFSSMVLGFIIGLFIHGWTIKLSFYAGIGCGFPIAFFNSLKINFD